MNPDGRERQTVLLVDDEPSILTSSSLLIRSEGIGETITLEDAREVMPLLARRQVAAVVLDLSMPGIAGQEVLGSINETHPQIPVVVMTATNEVDTAVGCMRLGAYDYLVKPATKERFLATVRRALEFRVLRDEAIALRRHLLSEKLERENAFSPILTRSRKMRARFRYVESIAVSVQPVLITGETGVGKELLARAVHDASGRRGAFVGINVAGLDDPVFSDTLFGHTKGAFTGAHGPRDGVIAKASGGTLFLDEIGDLATSSQLKLLRLLHDGEYYPVGADNPRRTDARIVVATNRDLASMVDRGAFRQDLYFRLQTHQVDIPPLRERPGDIPLLFEHFLTRAAELFGRAKPGYTAALLERLQGYRFPGNVRELQALVDDAVARNTDDELSRYSVNLPEDESPGGVGNEIGGLSGSPGEPDGDVFVEEPLPTLRELNNILVGEAMKRAEGNQGVAALLLGISRQALNQRLIRKKKARMQEPGRS